MKVLISLLLMHALTLSANAAAIDWTETLNGTTDQAQTDNGYLGWGFFQNLYGWDRQVTLWQEFVAGETGELGGISLYVTDSYASGHFDLNIYSGTGVEGSLLESTRISWTTDFDAVHASDTWYTFSLENAVSLTSGSTYTFSIENLSASGVFGAAVSSSTSDPYTQGLYMQQGYQMPNKYHTGGTGRDIAFQTVMIPEPATASLVVLFGAVMLLRHKRLR